MNKNYFVLVFCLFVISASAQVKPGFDHHIKLDQCKTIVEFIDTSVVYANDSILSVEWSFGDGKENKFGHSVTHEYTSGGFFKTQIIVRTLNNYKDSINNIVRIPGPQPVFEIVNKYNSRYSLNCDGETIEVVNWSNYPYWNPKFILHWGDGETSESNYFDDTLRHVYNKSGIYSLYLQMIDSISGAGMRCSRTYPDTSSNAPKHEILVEIMPQYKIVLSENYIETIPFKPVYFTINTADSFDFYYIDYGDGSSEEVNSNIKMLSHSYNSEGTYSAIISGGTKRLKDNTLIKVRCSLLDTCTLKVKWPLSVRHSDAKLKSYPNPINDKLVVLKQNNNLARVTVLNSIGEVVFEGFTSKSETTFDFSLLPSGLYVLQIKENSNASLLRFIKE